MVSRLLMMILPFSILTILYFGAHIMDVCTNIYLLESRNNATERKINKLIGETTIWDSKFIPFYNRQFQQYAGWINSSYTIGIWIFTLIIAALIVHIIVAFTLIQNLLYNYFFTSLSITATSFTVIQYILLQWTGASFIERTVLKMSGITVKEVKTPTNVLIVPVLTFVFGFFSFAMISLSEGSFWLGGMFDIPMLLVPTILIGDSIFLPIINAKITRFIIDDLGVQKMHSRFLIFYSIIALLGSLLMSGLSHWAWATDQYTDHISSIYRKLSIGGWWHLIFSIIQTFILFFFPYIWKKAIDSKDKNLEANCTKIWWWTFGFSLLMVVNYTVQYIAGVYGNISIPQALIEAKFTFFPALISLIILLTMKSYKKIVFRPSK